MTEEESKKVVSKKHLARLEREKIQRKYLITGVTVALLLVVGLIIYGILDQTFFQKQKTVATVGNDKITQGEFQGRVRYARWQLIQQYNRTMQMAEMFGGLSSGNGSYFQNSLNQIQSQLDNPTNLGESVLAAIIDERVVEQEAAKQGITVTDKEVEDAIQQAFGFYANGTPTPAATRAMAPTSTLSAAQLAIITITPTATMSPTATEVPTETPAAVSPTPTVESTPLPTSTPYTIDGFKKQYQDFLTGMKAVDFPESEFRDAFRISLLRKKLSEKITADVAAKEDQVWARHILVSDEQAAKDVLARLQKGENWASIAAEVSKDTSNKDTGGDLGWFGKEKMVKEFSDAAFAMKIGEISQPVKSSFGYHIIQVLGHEERELTSAELADKQNTAFEEWLTKVQAEIGVKKNDITGIVPTEPSLTQTASAQ
ncbi:peptidylprolyl isomerase [Leptolinea tardivitalis]|uniref:peptidylprolyl isomerase n=1 Tax=Leptolinea tardivitalis TaxID=229920 RepID=UPI00078567C9|nr:peptidylprolyl isomerase [Leptolinea tardivitalis]GAP20582.1 parvulin-like peptidyl-prolyl isomerase [Leptolinea tardivitalis]